MFVDIVPLLAAAGQPGHFTASNALWALTIATVAVAFLVDLLSHRKPSFPSMKSSFWAALAWTAAGLAFGGLLWMLHGHNVGAQYFAGYLLERTLSIDNVFVFVLILDFFAVPAVLRHRALLFGVIAALVLRAIFIAVGGALLTRFGWMTYVFGAFLVYTAIKLFQQKEDHVDPEANPILKLMRRVRPVTDQYRGFKLWVKDRGRTAFTPLFVTLMAIGTTDVVFAVDSIPAIFAVTSSTFIVFAANAFALMGLLPLTFLLANAVERFAYLKHALAIVLGYVGFKMLLIRWYHVPTWVTLTVVVVVLGAGIAYSFYRTRGREGDGDDSNDDVSPEVGSRVVIPARTNTPTHNTEVHS